LVESDGLVNIPVAKAGQLHIVQSGQSLSMPGGETPATDDSGS